MKIKKMTFYALRPKDNDNIPLPSGLWPLEEIADLLRHDNAFICADVPNVVLACRLCDNGGAFGGHITHERWRSYGFKLIEIKSVEMERYVIPESCWPLIHPEMWVTKRTVPPNYIENIDVTLYVHLSEETLEGLKEKCIEQNHQKRS